MERIGFKREGYWRLWTNLTWTWIQCPNALNRSTFWWRKRNFCP